VSKKVFDEGASLNAKVVRGVNKLADAVSATLGPKGRTVILHAKGRNPILTKDGVSVASFTEFEDPFENAAAQVLKQAAAVTATEAGDGTTTATVLARAIVNKSQRYITAGASPIELKRGMDKAVAKIVENLKEIAKPITSIDDIEHIATISANGDKQIGKILSVAVDKAGKDGAVTIEEARSVETSLDIVEGFQIDSGYVSPQFITDEHKGSMRYDNALILVTDAVIENVEDLLPILEVAARENRPFVIVSENIEGQALAAIILNAVRGTMKVAAIKAPKYGEERRNILKDLALAVGATYISRESGMSVRDAKREHLGMVKSVESLKNWTTFVGGAGDYTEVEKRIEQLKVEIENTSDLRDCEQIQERITRLASGVAIIRVGGLTEAEMVERKHRIEDALEAVKSAQMEGILPGGGVGLLRASSNFEVLTDNEDQGFGVKIIVEACEEPIRKLAENCGEKQDIILEGVRNANGVWSGYNFAVGSYCDMGLEGIIDPAKVTRCALQNAVSAASILLTTSHAIIEVGN
jgi:chaperonin GroEL